MPFLRVMMFNMQLLPEIEVPIFGMQLMPTSGDEAEVRASLIAHAIKALPPSELPDILVGNEVFNEDARSVLTTSLAPLYPQIIDRFDDEPVAALTSGMSPIAGEFHQDSGLFLTSRWPIIPMPDGRSSRFIRYTDATGWDAFSRKGIGFVTVSTPIGLVTVACTHTQAASATDDENRGIRANQLAQNQAELTSLVGAPSPTAWRDVIVLGDLNIRGDQDPTVPGERVQWSVGRQSEHFQPTLDLVFHRPAPTTFSASTRVPRRDPGSHAAAGPAINHGRPPFPLRCHRHPARVEELCAWKPCDRHSCSGARH